MLCTMYMYMYIRVFDQLIWCTIGQKSFLFGTARSHFGQDGADNYDYIITSSINSLLIGSRHIPNGPHRHTLSVIEPIWPMLQKLWRTCKCTMYYYNVGIVQMYMYIYTVYAFFSNVHMYMYIVYMNMYMTTYVYIILIFII